MKSTTACATALLLIALSPSALGQTAAITSATSTGEGYPVAFSNHGWEFISTVRMTVTHLGLWQDGTPGLGQSHEIGLFRVSDAALLTSGIIPQGTSAPLINSFRYINTPHVTLTAGVSY